MEGDTITHEERKRLDRQRFIGWETQKKLLSSRVLITPANGPNTELAKNLILAGVNVTLYDDATVTEDDFESNFLVAESDIGRLRGEAVFQKLKDMNPSGKNELFLENLLNSLQKHPDQSFSRYSIIVTSTGDFTLMSSWDDLSRRLNIPYYNLICCGLHAFSFISLGSAYAYKEINKKDNSVSKIWTIDSLTVQEALDWKNATKNKEFIAAIYMMWNSQKQGLSYDPFSPDEATLEVIVKLGLGLVGQKHSEFLTTFAKTYNIDYCPVYSVIGSIISQQIIKITENQTQPGMNWLVFNSEEGYSNIVKIASQKEKITSKLPEVNQTQ